MKIKTQVLLITTFIILLNVWTYPQYHYEQTYKFKNYEITIKEEGRNNLDYLNNVFIEIKADNNLIRKKVNMEGDYIDTSYVVDFDADQNPEIIIISRSPGSGAYGRIYVYEFHAGNLYNVNIPELSSDIAKFYQGHDSFVMSKGKITHKFPAYLPNDANCCPTGGDVIINYKYKNDKIIEVSHKHIPPKGQKGFDVIIKSAVDLPKMDRFSNTDCFIELYVDGIFVGKTKTIKNDNSPYFNEKISTDVYKGGKIEFRLLDEDLSKNKLIGKVLIVKPLSGSYPIQREDADGSIITKGELSIEFIK